MQDIINNKIIIIKSFNSNSKQKVSHYLKEEKCGIY